MARMLFQPFGMGKSRLLQASCQLEHHVGSARPLVAAHTWPSVQSLLILESIHSYSIAAPAFTPSPYRLSTLPPTWARGIRLRATRPSSPPAASVSQRTTPSTTTGQLVSRTSARQWDCPSPSRDRQLLSTPSTATLVRSRSPSSMLPMPVLDPIILCRVSTITLEKNIIRSGVDRLRRICRGRLCYRAVARLCHALCVEP